MAGEIGILLQILPLCVVFTCIILVMILFLFCPNIAYKVD